MKRSWTAAAVALSALGVLAGCNDYNNSVQYNTGATITNLSPSGLAAGKAPSNAAQCQNQANSPTYACFTIYVVASSANPWLAAPTVAPVLEWNGAKMPTTYIDTTDISALIPYSLVANPGTATVIVYQPQGQGTGYNGLSNGLTFTIYGPANPFPTLSSVAPTSAAYCDSTSTKCANVPITVTGTNFLSVSQNGGSSVTITGASTYDQETAITVNSISSTQMKATIPGTLLCASGSYEINVINPPSAVCLLNCPDLGGGDTNSPPSGQPVTTQTFTVTNSSAVNTCPAQVPVTPAVRKAAISQDGRYVAYALGQGGGTSQILLRDTCLGATNQCAASTSTVSVAGDGTSGNADSQSVSMTPDGRYIAFSSAATNLVDNAPAGAQVYLRDTCNDAKGACKASTQLVSSDSSGALSGMMAVLPTISESGRFVAFLAQTPAVAAAGASTNLVSVPSGTGRQLFVRDTCIGATNCTPKTMRLTGASTIAEDAPAISRDGRYIAYTSGENGTWQIVLSDTCLGVEKGCSPSTRTVSAALDGSFGNAASHNAVMTADGRYIAFSSAASNLTENALVGRQVYLRDTCVGAATGCKTSTTLVSTDEQGQLSGAEAILPSLSTTARYVAFLAVNSSSSGNSTMLPNSGLQQVFLRDTCLAAGNCTPQSTRVSLQPGYVLADSGKPAGPALAGSAKQIALVDGKSATMFTPTIVVDDRVLLAIPNQGK
jgi:Tol biopolymer transport system component